MTTIICIDNDSLRSERISNALEQAGFHVLITSDDDQGLKLILERQPQLVFYTIPTPHQNRYRILKTVRDEYPLMAEVPFVFLSGRTGSKQILIDLNSGADAVVTEPVDLTRMIATIHASLRQINRIKYKNDSLLVLDI